MIPITPAEIALLLPLIQQAILLGESVYEAWQIKDMIALQAKLTQQLADTTKDRATANADITARDTQLEKDLGIPQPIDVSKAFDTSDKPKP